MDAWPCLANRDLLIGDFHMTFHWKASISESLVCFSLVNQEFTAM